MADNSDAGINAQRAAGIGVNPLKQAGEAGPEWVGRRATQFGEKGPEGATQVRTSAEKGRLHELWGQMFKKDINALSMDDSLSNLQPLQRPDAILATYLHYGAPEKAELAALQGKKALSSSPAIEELANRQSLFEADPQKYATLALSPAEEQTLQVAKQGLNPTEQARLDFLAGLPEQARKLADWHSGLDIPALKQVGGYFGNDLMADLHTDLLSGSIKINQANHLIPHVARIAQEGGEGVPVMTMLGQLGLDSPQAELLLKNELGNRGIDLAQTALSNLKIPSEQAKSLLSFTRPAQAPSGAGPLLGAYDSFLNMLKAGQTSWPGTLMRNLFSDTMQRWFHGGSALTPLAQGRTAMSGGVIPGIAGKIGFAGSDADAMQEIARLAWEHGLSDTKKFQVVEAAGMNPARQTTQRLMQPIGAAEPGLIEKLRQTLPWNEGSIKPWEIRGVAGKEKSLFTPVAAAQATQGHTEHMNRLGTFIDSLTQGMSPAAAMEQVTKAHFDFSSLTPFERDVMRRLVPYYSWLRQSVPASVSEIANNPGGRMAQTMKLLNTVSGQQGFIPEYMSQTGYAVPAGGPNEQGKQTYLTSLGLPFEDIVQLTNPRSLVGALAPFPRLPFELAMGRQAMSGRDMPNNFPMPGAPLFNMLAMNTPASRVLSTYRNLQNAYETGTLPQAAVQALLGPRLTTIDPAQARASAIRDYADQSLRANPAIREFHRLSVPREMAASLSPQDMLMLRLLATRQPR